jgi:hypothetical protein
MFVFDYSLKRNFQKTRVQNIKRRKEKREGLNEETKKLNIVNIGLETPPLSPHSQIPKKEHPSVTVPLLRKGATIPWSFLLEHTRLFPPVADTIGLAHPLHALCV